jgi:predicted TIM-barrel fold metal-dependent hydrolase
MAANLWARLEARGQKVARNRVLDLMLGGLQDRDGSRLVAEMDSAGIDVAVLLIPDFTVAMRQTFTIEETFAAYRAVLERHPGRFIVMGGVDPRWGADGVALFERSIRDFGFKGLKVYPPCGYSPSDRSLYPLYETCARHRLPVLVHIGPSSPGLSLDTCHPFLLDEAIRDFPSVPFILGHGGAHFVEECAMLAAFRPNVYVDVSGFQCALRGGSAAECLRHLCTRGINHKLLFGTDWPVFRMRGDQRDAVASIFGPRGALSALPEEEVALFAAGNFDRMFAAEEDNRWNRSSFARTCTGSSPKVAAPTSGS